MAFDFVKILRNTLINFSFMYVNIRWLKFVLIASTGKSI